MPCLSNILCSYNKYPFFPILGLAKWNKMIITNANITMLSYIYNNYALKNYTKSLRKDYSDD